MPEYCSTLCVEQYVQEGKPPRGGHGGGAQEVVLELAPPPSFRPEDEDEDEEEEPRALHTSPAQLHNRITQSVCKYFKNLVVHKKVAEETAIEMILDWLPDAVQKLNPEQLPVHHHELGRRQDR